MMAARFEDAVRHSGLCGFFIRWESDFPVERKNTIMRTPAKGRYCLTADALGAGARQDAHFFYGCIAKIVIL